jgi:hypothetical protein
MSFCCTLPLSRFLCTSSCSRRSFAYFLSPCLTFRYPDPLHLSLKEKIGALRGVKKEQIFLGVGSDEAIDILFRIFCKVSYSKALNSLFNTILLYSPPWRPSLRRFYFATYSKHTAHTNELTSHPQPTVDNAVTTPPTYGMYKVCAKVNDVAVKTGTH